MSRRRPTQSRWLGDYARSCLARLFARDIEGLAAPDPIGAGYHEQPRLARDSHEDDEGEWRQAGGGRGCTPANHSTITLLVSGGTIDSASGSGTVDHAAEVKLTLGRWTVLFKDSILRFD